MSKKGKLSLGQKAKLLLNIYKAYKEVKKMHKGIKTTEFWLTLIAIIGSLIPMLSGVISPNTWAIVSAVMVGLYTIARAWVKSTASTTDDKILDAIKKDIIDNIPKENENKTN